MLRFALTGLIATWLASVVRLIQARRTAVPVPVRSRALSHRRAA